MANLTITEILGGDNIAGSRVTINNNFQAIASAINSIQQYLDPSYTPGGSLNVGNAIVKKYTNATTTQIFTCEATGLFQGGLNVSLNLGVTQSATINQSLTVSKNITFDGAAVGGGSFTSLVSSAFGNEIINSQLYNSVTVASALDPQTLSGTGTTRSMAVGALAGYSVLRLNLSTWTGSGTTNCNTIVLPQGDNGQTLTVIIDGPAGAGMTSFTISATNLATTGDIVFNGPLDTADVRKLAITLFQDHNGWRVLNITQPATTYSITY